MAVAASGLTNSTKCKLSRSRRTTGPRRQLQQGKRHAEALRCLACIWLRIIFAMWRDGTTYDPTRFLLASGRMQPAPAL